MKHIWIPLLLATATLGLASIVPPEWLAPVALTLIVVSYVTMRAATR